MTDVVAGGIDEANPNRLPGDGVRGRTVAGTEQPLLRRGEITGQSFQIQQQRFARWGAATLVVGDVVVAAGAPFLNKRFDNWNGPLEAGGAVIAVATFLGVWLLQRQRGAGRYDRNSMRDAIAAAFVATYLVIVGWATFSHLGGDQTQLARDLVANFTVLVGVVVGGYFGADALKQVTLINAQRGQQGGEISPN